MKSVNGNLENGKAGTESNFAASMVIGNSKASLHILSSYGNTV
jgi:hypothetical protein